MPVHAFIFPGQGSQSVGMGRDLAAAFGAAREVFQEVDEVLQQKLSKLMFEGPAEELTLTENTQPALMAMSLAVLRVLETEGHFKLAQKAILVAGHSLGEYSALAGAGSFSIADTARLLRLRGQAMQKAVPAGEGAMAALLGVEIDQAAAIWSAMASTCACVTSLRAISTHSYNGIRYSLWLVSARDPDSPATKDTDHTPQWGGGHSRGRCLSPGREGAP